MDLAEKQLFLKSHSLFKDLSLSQLKIIAESIKEVEFKMGQDIIEQDSVSDGAYFIVFGTVKVFRINEDGEEINLAVLGSGEIIGELGLIDNEPRSASINALKDTRLLLLTQKEFLDILKNCPDVAIILLKTLATRVRNTSKHLEELQSKNLYERTWATLQTLANFFPNQNIELSQEELATIIGGTRSRVTEVLNTLKKQGKIILSHKNIHLVP